jgi:hypothetical protein
MRMRIRDPYIWIRDRKIRNTGRYFCVSQLLKARAAGHSPAALKSITNLMDLLLYGRHCLYSIFCKVVVLLFCKVIDSSYLYFARSSWPLVCKVLWPFYTRSPRPLFCKVVIPLFCKVVMTFILQGHRGNYFALLSWPLFSKVVLAIILQSHYNLYFARSS